MSTVRRLTVMTRSGSVDVGAIRQPFGGSESLPRSHQIVSLLVA